MEDILTTAHVPGEPLDLTIDGEWDGREYIDGDFKVGLSDEQHQQHILLACWGDYKQYPTLGAGLENFYLDEHSGNMIDTIKRNFREDGLKVSKAKITANGELNIEASYE